MWLICNYFFMSMVVIDLFVIIGSMLERLVRVLIND